MNKKELKGLIKEVVRECMAEMLMELKLENIIESAMSKMTVSAPSVSSRNLNEEVALVTSKPKSKTDLRKKLGVSEAEWNAIYSNVDTSNPILSENRSADPISSQPKPPEVSANELAEAGLYKDYSKFL